MFWNRVIKITFISFCVSQFGGLSSGLSMEVPRSPARLSYLANVMLDRYNGERIIKEAFCFEQLYRIPSSKGDAFNLAAELCEDENKGLLSPVPIEKKRGLLFKIYYQPDRKTGASHEVLNCGEMELFNALFLVLEDVLMNCPVNNFFPSKKPRVSKADQLESESGDEEAGKLEETVDASSDEDDSEEESDEDYFEATLAVMERVKNSVPDAKLITLMEKSINEQEFIDGLAAAIIRKKKELKRKREEQTLYATMDQYITNYQSYLSSLANFTINSCVLINGDEGVLTIELSLQDILETTEASPLPARLVDLRYQLQRWSVGKLVTLHAKQVEKINLAKKEQRHSGYFL